MSAVEKGEFMVVTENVKQLHEGLHNSRTSSLIMFIKQQVAAQSYVSYPIAAFLGWEVH